MIFKPRALRTRSIIFSFVLMSIVFMAEVCPLEEGTTCVYIPDGRGSAESCGGSSAPRLTPVGSGGDGSGPAPTPTPPPLHYWLLFPGAAGHLSEWYDGPFSSGGPDHHDVAGAHAVDVGGGGCEVCSDVRYYDSMGSVITLSDFFQTSCIEDRGGGERVELTLTSIEPVGVVQAVVDYRHLTGAIQSGAPVTHDTVLGQVHGANPKASEFRACWTGPHLHQGVRAVSGVVTEFTGVYKAAGGANCQGWLDYAGSQDESYADSYNQLAHPNVFCYSVTW